MCKSRKIGIPASRIGGRGWRGPPPCASPAAMSLESDLALANRLAEAAGAAIRPFFRAAFSHEAKAAASPVSAADRAPQAALPRLLQAEGPAPRPTAEGSRTNT